MGVGTPKLNKFVVTRQVPGQQFRERANQTAIAGSTLGVLISPSGQVGRGEAGGIEPTSTAMNEGDSITKNGFHHRISSRQPKARASRDGGLALEAAGVELEIVDMSVEAFSSPSNSDILDRNQQKERRIEPLLTSARSNSKKMDPSRPPVPSVILCVAES